MDKQHIRNRIRKERDQLSPEFVQEKSEAVYQRLIRIPQLEAARTVMTYAAFSNEIRTAEITGWLLYHKKTVCLPVVESHTMYAVRYCGTELESGSFGIGEPPLRTQDIIEPADISVVLCPGIAFSRDRMRVGFGKGYYDSFLQQAPQAFKIGLAYDFQVLGTLEGESHDVPMDMIVTPDYVIG